MLKNRGVAVVSQRVGIPARRDRSFLLSAKGRGFSFLDFERNKKGFSFQAGTAIGWAGGAHS